MINLLEAKIAKETLVDVATPEGQLGVVEFVSTRKGVKGAMVDVGGPWGGSNWHALTDLSLSGSSRMVVERYL